MVLIEMVMKQHKDLIKEIIDKEYGSFINDKSTESQQHDPVLYNIVTRLLAASLAHHVIVHEPIKTGVMEYEGNTCFWATALCHDDSWEKTMEHTRSVFEWCKTTFGSEYAARTRWWVDDGGKYVFKNKQDLTMFLMKWS